MSQRKSLFESLNQDNCLEGLELDRDLLLAELGLSRRDPRTGELGYPDFSAMHAEDSWDLSVMTLSHSEFVSDVLARTKKRRKDAEAESEEVFGKVIAKNTGGKITEAKALAKGDYDYIKHMKVVSSLYAWEDYLVRFLDTISKYHYLAKARTDELIKARKGA